MTHNVLNAKQHFREAEIVAQAGRRGAVTVATNMAGRGVDIILGGNPELLAQHELAADGVDLDYRGGLGAHSTRRRQRSRRAAGPKAKRCASSAGSTCSAASATRAAASTTSSVAARAARATRARAASTSASTTSCSACSPPAP